MKTLRQRINNNCKNCIYDPTDSLSWRQQVEMCTSYTCDFWDIRPLPVGTTVSTIEKHTNNIESDMPSEAVRAVLRH